MFVISTPYITVVFHTRRSLLAGRQTDCNFLFAELPCFEYYEVPMDCVCKAVMLTVTPMHTVHIWVAYGLRWCPEIRENRGERLSPSRSNWLFPSHGKRYRLVNDIPPPSPHTTASGRRTLEITHALEESPRTKKPVMISVR